MKQYWYFRYFIKVPNAGRGGEGEGRERGGKVAVLQSYESRYRLLTGVKLRRGGEAIQKASRVPAFVLSFRSRPPGKSSILMDELAIFNYWNGGQIVSGAIYPILYP